MTMTRYYGTAIPQPAGFGMAALEQRAQANVIPSPTLEERRAQMMAELLSTAWCDEAACPAAKCVHCKETSR